MKIYRLFGYDLIVLEFKEVYNFKIKLVFVYFFFFFNHDLRDYFNPFRPELNIINKIFAFK